MIKTALRYTVPISQFWILLQHTAPRRSQSQIKKMSAKAGPRSAAGFAGKSEYLEMRYLSLDFIYFTRHPIYLLWHDHRTGQLRFPLFRGLVCSGHPVLSAGRILPFSDLGQTVATSQTASCSRSGCLSRRIHFYSGTHCPHFFFSGGIKSGLYRSSWRSGTKGWTGTVPSLPSRYCL